MELDERKLRVMRAVVEAYVASAQPVGSRTIARDFDLGVSPATIRNEMADLEEMGLLEQPHTSAGRVPSDLGYRMYVDQIACVHAPDIEELERIRIEIDQRVSQARSLFQSGLRLLSEMTDCLSLMAGPFTGDSVVSAIQLIPLRSERIMFLIVTEDGLVQNQVVEFAGIEGREVEHASAVFNHFFRGHTINEIVTGPVLDELRHELGYCHNLFDVALTVFRRHQLQGAQPDFWIDGAVNILKQPEFHDVSRTKRVLTAISDGSVLRDLIRQFPHQELLTLIGAENSDVDVQECSIVSAVYYIGGRPAGRIGVIGPRRMDYGKIMGVVQATTQVISDSLSDGSRINTDV